MRNITQICEKLRKSAKNYTGRYGGEVKGVFHLSYKPYTKFLYQEIWLRLVHTPMAFGTHAY